MSLRLPLGHIKGIGQHPQKFRELHGRGGLF